MKSLVIIDSNALIHRCFHALPPLTTPKGEPIGAVYGTASIIIKMLREIKPDYLAACFDLAEPTFRHQEYKKYKAQRPKTPEDLGPQFNLCRKLFDVLGIKIFEQSGFEADDLIGTLTDKFSTIPDLKITIVTGDLDTLQLVKDDKIVVYTMKKSIQETALYNEEAVLKRFELKPNQMIDFKGLKGDPSDNIPGVLGIGEKGAIKLLQSFGNLENLYQKIENNEAELNDKLRAKLVDQKEQAFFSKYLASIRKDVPLEISIENLAFTGLNRNNLEPLFREWRFDSLLKRLDDPQTSQPNHSIVNTSGQPKIENANINQLIQGIKEYDEIILWRNSETLEIFWGEKIFQINFSQPEINNIKSILTSKKVAKIGHHLKELYKELINFGLELNGLKHDVKIAAWILNSEAKDYTLEKIWQRTFREPLPNQSTIGCIKKLAEFQRQKLKEFNLENVFENIEMPLIPILAKMETTGITLNVPHFQFLTQEISKEIKALEKEIHQITGHKFNIGSAKQLSEVLFQKLQIQTKGLRKTPAGVISTQETELAKLRDKNPAINLILKYRELMKLKTTYLESFVELANAKTSRLHTNYNQTGTATGRLSSDNPNMQNIPAQGDWAEKIRRGLIASENKKFLGLDYSQIELRVAASLSKDPKMIKAFEDGKDIHTMTAAEINNVPFSEVTPGMRRQAKTLNFGVLYGMGSRAFSETTGMPKTQAKEFIDEYYRDFVGIKDWQEKIKSEGRTFGFVKTIIGRRRWTFDLTSENQKYRAMAERAAINFPIQGSAADLIKMAMIAIDQELTKLNLHDKISMILQIHDELIFEVDDDSAEKAKAIIKKIMETIYPLSVELKVDAHIGQNLAETK